jgi:tetratricopeptide (TPR) repeat protein
MSDEELPDPHEDDSEDLESEEVLWERIPTVQGVERAHTFYELSARVYSRGQFDEALALAESARDIYASVEGESEGLAGAYSAIGYNLNQLKRIDEAAAAMSKAVEILRESKSPLAIDLACTLGEWLFTSQEFQRTIDCMSECVREHLVDGNDSGAANDLHLMGCAYLELNEPEKALESFMEAKDLFSRAKEVLNVGRCEEKIANCLVKLGDGQAALHCAQRALDIYVTSRDLIREKRALRELARAQNLIGKKEECLESYERILDILHNEEPKDYKFIVEVEKEMAQVLISLDRQDEGEEILRRLSTVESILTSESNELPLDGEDKR